jgi:hypothetical protein
MKKKINALQKKLQLNKLTITSLNQFHPGNIKGGESGACHSAKCDTCNTCNTCTISQTFIPEQDLSFQKQCVGTTLPTRYC